MASGTRPTQIRLTESDKAVFESIRVRNGLPSLAAAIRWAGQYVDRTLHRAQAVAGHGMSVTEESSQSIAEPQVASTSAYVPNLDEAEIARRNQAAMRLLDTWEREGDEEEQRETMAVLRKALGEDRVASSRNLFP